MSSRWLRDNLFVVAALALPLAVVVFFLAATTVPRWLVADPGYDLLLAVEHYNTRPGQIALGFRVVDGRLVADAHAYPAYQSAASQQLYLFDAGSAGVRRIEVEIPAEIRRELLQSVASGQGADRVAAAPAPVGAPGTTEFAAPTFAVAETENLSLLGGAVSPDGYVFENLQTGGRGLFAELFGMGASATKLRIAKDGRVIALPIPDAGASHYYYATAKALGWVER